MKENETKILPLHYSERGFHVGPENRMLDVIIQWVLEGAPVVSENAPTMPITFFGPSGCGKSHFVYGLYQRWKKEHSTRKPLLQTAHDFVRQYTGALESKTIDQFRNRLRNASLWVVDRLEDFAGHPAAMEEYLYSLDCSMSQDNIILITSNGFPGELSFLPQPLIARIIGGLTVQIQPPELKTRTAMIREITKNTGMQLSQKSIDILAEPQSQSYQSLCGMVSRLKFATGNQVPNVAFVKKFLKNDCELMQPTLQEVLRYTAKHFSLKQADLKGKSRISGIARARAVAIFLSRQLTDKSLKEIGQFYGKRDHKTIAHHCEEFEAKFAADTTLRCSVSRIREMIAYAPKR